MILTTLTKLIKWLNDAQISYSTFCNGKLRHCISSIIFLGLIEKTQHTILVLFERKVMVQLN